jgi:ElaA protein
MVPSLIWQWRSFAEFSTLELYAMLRARSEVFVVEQVCAFLDPDGVDVHARHLLGWSPTEPAMLAAYLRLIAPGYKYAEASIGRVLTTEAFRGRGLGRALMHAGLREAAAVFPGHHVRIGAQQRLERFYASMGFRTVSDTYLEDGIDHVEMLIAPADMR